MSAELPRSCPPPRRRRKAAEPSLHQQVISKNVEQTFNHICANLALSKSPSEITKCLVELIDTFAGKEPACIADGVKHALSDLAARRSANLDKFLERPFERLLNRNTL